MVYQSVIDALTSVFMVLTAVVEVKDTDMSRKSVFDQFVCHIWLARQQIWYFTVSSTYGIMFMAFDRYAAVIHPSWYNCNVRLCWESHLLQCYRSLFHRLTRTIDVIK